MRNGDQIDCPDHKQRKTGTQRRTIRCRPGNPVGHKSTCHRTKEISQQQQSKSAKRQGTDPVAQCRPVVEVKPLRGAIGRCHFDQADHQTANHYTNQNRQGCTNSWVHLSKFLFQISAPQLLNSSPPQLLNSSTPQLLNSSPPQLLNSSPPPLLPSSTPQLLLTTSSLSSTQ